MLHVILADIMERARRSIKTPKRFDDEPFENPRKNSNLFKQQQLQLQQQLLQQQQQQQQQQARVSELLPKFAPEQTPSKNIIKVKLSTKSKTRDPPQLVKAAPSPPPPSPPVGTPQQSQQPALTPATSQSSQSSPPRPISPAPQPPKLYPQKRQLKTPRYRPVPPPLKVSSDTSGQSSPVTPGPPQKVRKQRSPSRPAPAANQTPLNQSLASSTPTSCQQQQQPIPVIRRPKIRRPRTPPAFGNLIPNVVLPFWDARTAAEEHEDDNVKELVHCQCGISEELGLIVQCETCLTWQHAHCLGIEKADDVPDGYTCQACSDPKFARESMRYSYDQEWLLKGRMKRFACARDKANEKVDSSLQVINKLIDYAIKIYQLKHSLKVKSRLLRVADEEDPDLKLFRNPWPVNYKHMDGSPFVPTMSHMTSCMPALSLSAMNETPDPGYIPVETVAEASLPEIGQLEDVSAILDNTDIPNSGAISLQKIEPQQEATTPDGYRANLRLHIQQTEEFISMELATIEKQFEQLQKDSLSETDGNPHTSLQSLRSDLNAIKKYIASTKKGD